MSPLARPSNPGARAVDAAGPARRGRRIVLLAALGAALVIVIGWRQVFHGVYLIRLRLDPGLLAASLNAGEGSLDRAAASWFLETEGGKAELRAQAVTALLRGMEIIDAAAGLSVEGDDCLRFYVQELEFTGMVGISHALSISGKMTSSKHGLVEYPFQEPAGFGAAAILYHWRRVTPGPFRLAGAPFELSLEKDSRGDGCRWTLVASPTPGAGRRPPASVD